MNNRIVLIQSILSAICFVLVGVGLLKPLLIISSNDGTFRDFYFWGGCFSKSYIGNLMRPGGYFDEPGALAFWAVYGLMLNYVFIKDRIIDKYLPYFTASTLSVAYFIQISLYAIFKNVTKIYRLIPLVFLLFLAIGFINTTRDSDFDIYSKTIARFEYDSEMGIAGNTRQNSMEAAKQLFLKSPIIGVGGQNFGNSQEGVSDNPYEILAKDGIIGLIISYLPLLCVLFINKRREVLVAIIIISIGYLQRPLHINFIHDLYLWSFLLFAIIDAKNRNIKARHDKAACNGVA